MFLEGIGGNSKNLVKAFNNTRTRLNTNAEESTITSPPTPDQFPAYQLPTLRATNTSPATEYTFSAPRIRHETGDYINFND